MRLNVSVGLVIILSSVASTLPHHRGECTGSASSDFEQVVRELVGRAPDYLHHGWPITDAASKNTPGDDQGTLCLRNGIWKSFSMFVSPESVVDISGYGGKRVEFAARMTDPNFYLSLDVYLHVDSIPVRMWFPSQFRGRDQDELIEVLSAYAINRGHDRELVEFLISEELTRSLETEFLEYVTSAESDLSVDMDMNKGLRVVLRRASLIRAFSHEDNKSLFPIRDIIRIRFPDSNVYLIPDEVSGRNDDVPILRYRVAWFWKGKIAAGGFLETTTARFLEQPWRVFEVVFGDGTKAGFADAESD